MKQSEKKPLNYSSVRFLGRRIAREKGEKFIAPERARQLAAHAKKMKEQGAA